MNFTDMLYKRESCRAYRDKEVKREDLVKIVEAGRLSPSACNSQPWKFIVIDDPQAKKKMEDALVIENGKSACPWADQVPAFIMLVEEEAKLMPAAIEYYQNSQYFAQGDIAMAAMNMCYQAMDLGLSTCILGLNSQKKMEEYFHVPEGQIVRLVLAVGYAANETEPRKKVRKSMEEICSFNDYQ